LAGDELEGDVDVTVQSREQERILASVALHVYVRALVRLVGNNVCVIVEACLHQRVVTDVASRMNIGPSVEQKRDCT
jgi:hypothetical protein